MIRRTKTEEQAKSLVEFEHSLGQKFVLDVAGKMFPRTAYEDLDDWQAWWLIKVLSEIRRAELSEFNE